METKVRPTANHLRAAVQLASRAPSLHNTQPWRWALRPDGLDLYADRFRQLTVADPAGHDLAISCGAALELARLGLAAAGCASVMHLMPDRRDPDLLARMTVTGFVGPDQDTERRVDAARRRYSDRRPFAARRVPEGTIDLLTSAAAGVGVFLAHPLGDPPQHLVVPTRDFEVGVTGARPSSGDQHEDPVLAVVMTDGDGTESCLRAGAALARLLVEAQVQGLATSIISQPVTRPGLGERAPQQHAQVVVRIGWPSDSESGSHVLIAAVART